MLCGKYNLYYMKGVLYMVFSNDNHIVFYISGHGERFQKPLPRDSKTDKEKN